MTDLNLDASDWMAVNDGVMGDVSRGRVEGGGGRLAFTGDLSLENNGGFASVRRAVVPPPTGTDRVRLEVRGDGRSYQLRLRLDRNFDGIAWRAEFTTGGDWQTIVLPLAAFEPVFRGRRLPDQGRLEPAEIRQLGFMLADGRAGPFRLEIRSIAFLSAEERSP